MMPFFVDVILPIPVENVFTYALSDAEAAILQPGMRLAVSFGKSKIYAALAYKTHQVPPRFYQAKAIHSILDQTPIVTPIQFAHWFWIAEYYLCAIGEVFRAAVPNAFLLESETIIVKNDAFSSAKTLLQDDEKPIYEALQRQSFIKISEITQLIPKKKTLSLLQNLLKKEAITIKEELYEQYKPKLIKHLQLHPHFSSEKALHQLLDELSNAPKQREIILALFSMETLKKPIKTDDLVKRANTSRAVVKTLITKGVLEEYTLQTDRIQYAQTSIEAVKTLNEYQQKALGQIKENFKNAKTTLLHGVTGSGKTEIYVKLIKEIFAEDPNQQILYLVPEIALTGQLIHRLQYYFGKKVAAYHSKYSANERVELWNNCMKNTPETQLIIGTRSALFLPFSKLRLIIIDEEHETSYKQFDPAPRYHARDSALVLANLHNAKVLLGSATPSIESYYNTQIGKYRLVEVEKRYGEILLPEIEMINLAEKRRKKQMKGHFSDNLIEAIQTALNHSEQIILFQNRRGYAPILECGACGYSPQCINCDVSLTYHKHHNQLRCHYCGYHIALQETCLACRSVDLDTKGFGTEQVETELKALFPEASVARMDWDTTKGKFGYEKLITAFEQHEMDVLVGTQMLTKGLDFKNVSLVGIMNADNLLHFPDFRAHERSFQLLLQVAGRAGRNEKQGKVIVQTYNPHHPILQYVLRNDYVGMYEEQVNERSQYKYPPFYKLIKITLKHRDYHKLNESADWLARSLKNNFGNLVLGPEFPPVPRIKNNYLKNILIKIPQDHSIKKTKQIIKRIAVSFNAIASYRSVRLIFNVDNY